MKEGTDERNLLARPISLEAIHGESVVLRHWFFLSRTGKSITTRKKRGKTWEYRFCPSFLKGEGFMPVWPAAPGERSIWR